MTSKASTKRCTICKEEVSRGDFHHSYNGRYAVARCKKCCVGYSKDYHQENKERMNKSRNAWRKENPEKVSLFRKKRVLRIKYGITLEDFQSLLCRQDGVCAICKKPEKQKAWGKIKMLSVDHDHKTGKVRGLLCSPCNAGLGQLMESEDVLLEAISYLSRNN